MSASGAGATPIAFTLTVDGAQVFTASGTATTASFDWDTTGMATGTHTLGLTVRDGTGATATASRTVTVSAPLKASFSSPAQGATVSGSTKIDMAATGAFNTPITFKLRHRRPGGLLDGRRRCLRLVLLGHTPVRDR